MGELGLCIDTCYRVEDIMAIVEDCNKEDTEVLETNELVSLVGKVQEAGRVKARKREGLIAQQLNLSEEQILEVRMSFAGLARTGVVGVSEVRLLLEAINPSMTPSNTDIEQLIADASPGFASPSFASQGFSRATDLDQSGRLSKIQEEDHSVRFASEKPPEDEQDGGAVRFAGSSSDGYQDPMLGAAGFGHNQGNPEVHQHIVSLADEF